MRTPSKGIIGRWQHVQRRTYIAVLLLTASCSFYAPTPTTAFVVSFPSHLQSKTVHVVPTNPRSQRREVVDRPFLSSPLRSAPLQIVEVDERLATETRPVAESKASEPSLSPRSRRLGSRRSRQPRKDKVQMTFLGTKAVTTPAAPLPPIDGNKSLNDFFATDEFRSLLFFRNDVTAVPNPTREQLDRWSSELRLGGGHELDNGGRTSPTQQVIQIKTYLNMPGLKILTTNTIGTKLLLPHSSGDGTESAGLLYPEYQFTLIDSELNPEGAPPFVWLFGKLIKFRDATSSFTRVRARNAGGVNCDKVVFTTEARLETRIRISRSALKAMPVNVESFERQGSKSIQKLLERELEPALLGFRDAYVKWISN